MDSVLCLQPKWAGGLLCLNMIIHTLIILLITLNKRVIFGATARNGRERKSSCCMSTWYYKYYGCTLDMNNEDA